GTSEKEVLTWQGGRRHHKLPGDEVRLGSTGSELAVRRRWQAGHHAFHLAPRLLVRGLSGDASRLAGRDGGHPKPFQGQPPLSGGIHLLEADAGIPQEAERPAVRRWTVVSLADRAGMGIHRPGRACSSRPTPLPLLLRPLQDRPDARPDKQPFFHSGGFRRQPSSWLGREGALPPRVVRLFKLRQAEKCERLVKAV